MSVELRLHAELYAPKAIEEAIALYAGHARIERRQDGAYAVLHVDSDRQGRAAKVARELGNYALGLTIQGKKTDAAPDAKKEVTP